MEDVPVYPDTISRLTTLLKQTFKGTFVAYYEGDPQQIPKDAMPCVIIEKVNSGLTNKDAPTGMDTYLEQISIRLVLDKLADVGQGPDVDLTERKLRLYIEGRDPNTGAFLPGTAMYALRTNITLGSTVIENDIDINYDIQARANMQLTSEGLISIITKTHIVVPNRL